MDLTLLQSYKERGLLKSQSHPNLPLTIWNYTPECQFSKSWDNITLSCRGLVTDDNTGEVVAKPFPKFFNLEERMHTPTEQFEVFTKMDGSLGILFWYNEQWVYASRGSFTSPHAEFFKQHTEYFYSEALKYLDKDFTYCFELIHPDFQVVVNYGNKQDVVLLGAYNTKSGQEWLNVLDHYKTLLPTVERHEAYSGSSMEALKALNTDNEEGFVIRFMNGDRCKIKFADYVRLHAVMTEVSTLSIWKMKVDNISFDNKILSMIPDECYDWIKSVENNLQNQFNSIVSLHEKALKNFNIEGYNNRKEMAVGLKIYSEANGLMLWLLFSLIDNKNYAPKLWNLLKPEYKKFRYEG